MQRTPRADSARPEKKPLTKKQKQSNIAIIGMSGLLVLGLGAALIQQNVTENRNAAAAAEYTPAEFVVETAEPKPPVTTDTPVSEAIDRLNNRDEPWTMTVLGDSTGNESTEWVQLMVQRLASATGRPAKIHTWSIETDSYENETDIAGSGEPIVVWNGSASGRKAAYSLEHIDEMAPEPSDLVVISHGHNQIDADEAVTQIGDLISWTNEAWDEQPSVALALQNPSTNERAARQAGNVKAIREKWEGAENMVLIDAYTAFEKSDDVNALLRDDKLHPAPEGSQLWADTAWEALDLGKFEG